MDLNFYTLAICLFTLPTTAQVPMVKIGNVTITGKLNNMSFRGQQVTVKEFYGIPYAKPPVGDLRFRKPEELNGWFINSATFNATSFGDGCLEFPVANWQQQNENCLFLNLFIPTTPADKTSGHAVMVWIHGGSFKTGVSNLYLGTLVAYFGNVIVVTMNYRLGIFGFLSTGDRNAPGNFGLWDQRMAIQWVQDNIRHFGGDNGRVSIAGESAGAISVMLHGFAPQNNGLFQRIIAQSGSSSIPLIDMERNNLQDAEGVGKSLKCSIHSTSELIECLRTQNGSDIYKAISSDSDLVSKFLPTVDGDLIRFNPSRFHELPNATTKDGLAFFQSLDLLTGVNAFDGSLLLDYRYFSVDAAITRNAFRTVHLPYVTKLLLKQDLPQEIIETILAEYTNWADPSDYRAQLVKLLGDASFATPCVNSALLHSNSLESKTFVYQFNPKPSVHILTSTPAWVPGAAHADELAYTFGAVFVSPLSLAWEMLLSQQMITYWTNFLKTGVPTFSGTEGMPLWPEFDADKQMYLCFEESLSNLSVKQYFLAREYNFWSKVVPYLLDVVTTKGNEQKCSVSSAVKIHMHIFHGLFLMFVIIAAF